MVGEPYYLQLRRNVGEGGSKDADEDLWFLPGPPSDEPDFLLPSPLPKAGEGTIAAAWVAAEAEQAARLAKVAGRLGALDERLRRGPEGWRQRLALIEAEELSWCAGDRIPRDRLALWTALRISSVRDDPRALARAGWAVRRLTGGPDPESDLGSFLGRHDPDGVDAPVERFADRAESWLAVMKAGRDMHPVTRACMGFHSWAMAGLGDAGDPLEAAVTAARIAADGGAGAVFAPLTMGGGGGLRAVGDPAARLRGWLEGMEHAILAATRHLEQIEAWMNRATAAMAGLSGRTPALLRALLAEQPLISAPMAEAITGASRAAIQRNLIWMEAQGLAREITGQGRFRFWRAET